MTNTDVFEERTADYQVFIKIYSQVATRCFDIGAGVYAMVPMADNYNHSHKAVEYYVISRKKILNQEAVKTHKEKNMMMNDYSFLFKKELADFDQ